MPTKLLRARKGKEENSKEESEVEVEMRRSTRPGVQPVASSSKRKLEEEVEEEEREEEQEEEEEDIVDGNLAKNGKNDVPPIAEERSFRSRRPAHPETNAQANGEDIEPEAEDLSQEETDVSEEEVDARKQKGRPRKAAKTETKGNSSKRTKAEGIVETRKKAAIKNVVAKARPVSNAKVKAPAKKRVKKDPAQDPENWKMYRSFVLDIADHDAEEVTFRRGDFIRVKGEENGSKSQNKRKKSGTRARDQDSEDDEEEEPWIAMIEKIRALDKDHVSLNIRWLYASENQLKSIGCKPPANWLPQEVFYSDHVDVIEVQTVQDHASVKLVSDNIITPPVREDDYFYRSEVVIGRERHEARSKELKAMGVNVGKVSLPYIAPLYQPTCTCGEPYVMKSEKEQEWMIYCAECEKWFHRRCVDDPTHHKASDVPGFVKSGIDKDNNKKYMEYGPLDDLEISKFDDYMGDAWASIQRGEESLIGNGSKVIDARLRFLHDKAAIPKDLEVECYVCPECDGYM